MSEQIVGASPPKVQRVQIEGGGASDGAIVDGDSASIKASVLDYTNSNPLAVRLTDTSGDYVAAGAGTQYTEDAAAAANPVGGVIIGRRRDTLAGETTTDGDNVAVNATDKGELYVKHVDAIPVTDNSTTLSVDDGGGILTVDGTVAVTNAGLTELAAAIDTEVQVDVVGALPAGTNNIGDVDVLSSALPTGAATSAKQDDQTTALQLIDDIVYAEDAAHSSGEKGAFILGVRNSAMASATTTDGDYSPITVDSAARVNIAGQIGHDSAANGNPVTVGGYASAAAPSDVSADGDIARIWTTLKGAVNVADADGTLSVDDGGGNLSIDDGGNIITVDGTVAVTGVSTVAEQQTQTTHLATIAGDTTDIETAVELIDDTVYVDDADWTDNTSKHLLVGGVYQSAPHTVTDGDVTPFLTDENGRLMVAATIDADGLATEAKQDTIIGHLDGVEGLLTTIDGDTGNIVTSVQLLDDTVTTLGTDTYTEATSKGLTIGAVRRDADTTLVNTTNEFGPLQMDANGRLKVEAFSGETLPVSLTSTTVTGTVAVTQSGTWDEVGINDSGNSITVDYATTGSGTATGALRVELPTNGTGVIATVGAVTAITNALPAGTNAIGKLAANSGVDIGDVTLTAGTAEIGSLLPPDTDVTAHTNYAKKYYTNSGAVTDGIVWSPAAGKRWHVVSMFINTSAAATVTFEDDLAGGDSAVMKMELAANSGMTINFGEQYPLASGEDAADLLVTTSAGNIYITLTGYEI